MKIYLDDVREAPDDTWTVARTVNEAIELVNAHGDIPVDAISFDYDMGITCPLPHDSAWQPIGCNHTNGHQLMVWMQVYGFKARQVLVHTQNPMGRRALLASAMTIALDPVAACIPEAAAIERPPLRQVAFAFRAED